MRKHSFFRSQLADRQGKRERVAAACRSPSEAWQIQFRCFVSLSFFYPNGAIPYA